MDRFDDGVRRYPIPAVQSWLWCPLFAARTTPIPDGVASMAPFGALIRVEGPWRSSLANRHEEGRAASLPGEGAGVGSVAPWSRDGLTPQGT
jgi:hypothetical protein